MYSLECVEKQSVFLFEDNVSNKIYFYNARLSLSCSSDRHLTIEADM